MIRNCAGPLLLLGALGDTGGLKPLFDGQLGLFLVIVLSLFGRSRKEEGGGGRRRREQRRCGNRDSETALRSTFRPIAL